MYLHEFLLAIRALEWSHFPVHFKMSPTIRVAQIQTQQIVRIHGRPRIHPLIIVMEIREHVDFGGEEGQSLRPGGETIQIACCFGAARRQSTEYGIIFNITRLFSIS